MSFVPLDGTRVWQDDDIILMHGLFEDKDTKCRYIITVLAPRCVPLGPDQGLTCEDDLRSFFDDVKENVHRFNIEQNALGSDATGRQTEYSILAVRIGKAVTSRTGLSHSANI
ncbi:hypothetical protein NDA11_001012 [Ustilago hordei]|uniref:Uncharacterized protein n=1 Tax=Ustilago hordei TaxID=120017 RepID=I2G108_USTHO|nr:hypothetical protein NDA10_004691 [Ustilago hordei]KAJ1580985.1 hypothetical protein NDA15_002030 [Ustilago hordei]KAJ1582846.1 hypothetical protein NDA12_004129 [Ustilago hordei]KAJ1588533.1 hypothetical protein NDA11_001012 [Ustilago hordei]KAJ1600017.1 hypothetical protein NDA14_007129 [Ustilago hordei]